MPEHNAHTNLPENGDMPDLLSSTPQKIIRWGLFTLLLLTGLSIVLCCVINYPEILTADMTMTDLIETDEQDKPELSVVLYQQQGLGKSENFLLQNREELRIGQEFTIRPENYEETGTLKSIVSGLSKTCNADSCIISISLPEGFTTSFHKQIAFRPGMKGRAEVIVKKQSLMAKFISVLTQKIRRF